MDEQPRTRRRLKVSELAPGADRPRLRLARRPPEAPAPALPPPPPEGASDDDFDWAGYWDDLYSDPRYWMSVLPERPPEPVALARRSAANGSIIAAVVLGMRNVFDPERDKGEIIAMRDDSGDPDNPHKPFHLDFDPESPRRTKATVRPWAREHDGDDGGDDSDDGGDGD